jgi:hypothetical protein
VPGGCTLSVTFAHDEAAPEKELNAVTGDKTVMSNNRNVRAVKATVTAISVGYPDAGR